MSVLNNCDHPGLYSALKQHTEKYLERNCPSLVGIPFFYLLWSLSSCSQKKIQIWICYLERFGPEWSPAESSPNWVEKPLWQYSTSVWCPTSWSSSLLPPLSLLSTSLSQHTHFWFSGSSMICAFDLAGYSLTGFHVGFFVTSFVLPVILIILMWVLIVFYSRSFLSFSCESLLLCSCFALLCHLLCPYGCCDNFITFLFSLSHSHHFTRFFEVTLCLILTFVFSGTL